jgi:tetratricopeptide (TPR) repeat protein
LIETREEPRSPGPRPGDSFSLREAAELAGLAPSQVRSLVRRGIVTPGAPDGRLGFRDVVLLRATRRLRERFPPRRVLQNLRELRGQLGERSLAEIALRPVGAEIVATEGALSWVPESGQLVLDLGDAEGPGDAEAPVHVLPNRAREQAIASLYERAWDLEEDAPAEAASLYVELLELAPEHVDARLNLGRLLHELGEAPAARRCYETVLADDEGNALACFNLGVLHDDAREFDDARACYERALALDPAFVDAHHNAAALAERQGRTLDLMRHLRALRSLQPR